MNETAKSRNQKTVCQGGHYLCSLVTEMLRSKYISSNSKTTEIQVVATQLQYFPPKCLELYNSQDPYLSLHWRYRYHFTNGKTEAQRAEVIFQRSPESSAGSELQWVLSVNSNFFWMPFGAAVQALAGACNSEVESSQSGPSPRSKSQDDLFAGAPHAIPQKGSPPGRGRSRFYGHWSLYTLETQNYKYKIR